jgi:hypothetical protein
MDNPFRIKDHTRQDRTKEMITAEINHPIGLTERIAKAVSLRN